MVFGNATKPSRFCSFLTKCTIPCACHAKRHLNLQKWREQVVFCTFSLRHLLRATTACTFSTSELPKVARTCSDLYIFTSKCASRLNGVHFFDISTAKSGPHLVCFVHFHFEMCFAPQRRALFRHRNPIDQVRQFPAEKVIPYLRQKIPISFFSLPKLVSFSCLNYF